MIMVLAGPEGAGKTLAMTMHAIQVHNFHKKFYDHDFPIRCFPGYEILDEKGKVFSTELPIEEWVTMPENLSDCIICIDEAQIFFFVQDFMTSITKLFNNFARQRRKRNLTILMTIQDIGMLSKWIRGSVHVINHLWDKYWTYHARGESTAKRGVHLKGAWIDNKGFFTGRPGQVCQRVNYDAWDYWKNYNTDKIVDLSEGMQKVNIIKKETFIKDGEVVSSKEWEDDQLFMQLGAVVDDMRSRGVKEIGREPFRSYIEATGIISDPVTIGKMMKRLGIEGRKAGGDQEAFYNL